MSEAALYLWLKAFHLAAAITFVGGVLAAAVLIGSLATPDGASSVPGGGLEHLRRWHTRVTAPAMLIVWALGLALALQGAWFTSPWLQAKLTLVLLLSGLHGVQSGMLRRLEGGATNPSSLLRRSGPLTIALTLCIALLVILKPG